MTEQRKMTIARGLTRLKTIKAQLSNIGAQVGTAGAVSNKKRHPLGESTASLEKNHNQAKEAVNSLYQQFNDLTAEFVKIKLAIDLANLTTKISIGGRTMTIQEALIFRRDVHQYVQALNNQYTQSVMRATNEVDSYNRGVNTDGVNEAALREIRADVLYMVPRERINDVNTFLVEFMTELDGTLNEVNALTEIVL